MSGGGKRRARQTTTNKLYQHAHNHCLTFGVEQITTNELYQHARNHCSTFGVKQITTATTLRLPPHLRVVPTRSPPGQGSPIPDSESTLHLLPSPTPSRGPGSRSPRVGFVPLISSLRPDFASRRERFWTLCPLGRPVASSYRATMGLKTH